MPPPSVLLLASHHATADRMTALLRSAGFEVVPGWFNDARHPSPGGAAVDLVLVDLLHHAARSPAFTRMAAQLRVTLAYFLVDAQDTTHVIAELGGADGTAPVLTVYDDGQQFLDAVWKLLPPAVRTREQ